MTDLEHLDRSNHIGLPEKPQRTQKWQAEQLPYPRDADYRGAKGGFFDMSEDAEKLIGKTAAGDTFMYLFRRFGYPRFGWDGYKKLVQYHITTPMPGVLLVVEPDVTGAGTFGYMLHEDIDHACTEEERKPYDDWRDRFEAWVMNKHGIEIIKMFEQDNDKLQRVWKVWGADKEDTDFEDQHAMHRAFFGDQSDIRTTYELQYRQIEPYPQHISIEDRPDDSIMKRCHTALCAAVTDMLRPVYIRDVLIAITGELLWTESDEQVNNDVDYAGSSGCGAADKLEATP